jgi:hypothetical protein
MLQQEQLTQAAVAVEVVVVQDLEVLLVVPV